MHWVQKHDNKKKLYKDIGEFRNKIQTDSHRNKVQMCQGALNVVRKGDEILLARNILRMSVWKKESLLNSEMVGMHFFYEAANCSRGLMSNVVTRQTYSMSYYVRTFIWSFATKDYIDIRTYIYG